MSPWKAWALAGVVLYALAFRVLFAETTWLRRLMALSVLGTGCFLVLVALAYRRGPDAEVDPVPHALALTGIVVSVAASGLGLVLARRQGAPP